MNYDFSGYATKHDVPCSDGRTIRQNAFKDCDGERVPLVWHHQRNEPGNVLGHANLEYRNDGVYAYCTFNDTPNGNTAKALVEHGDITRMSIYANQLKQIGGDVCHGKIREVSLVVAGANPEAKIDNVQIQHEDGEVEWYDDKAIIYTGLDFTLEHAEDRQNDGKDDTEEDDETIKDVFDTLTEKQKKAVYAIVGYALDDGADDEEAEQSDEDEDEDSIEHNDEEGEDEMSIKHQNVFETKGTHTNELSHDDMVDIFRTANKIGSLKEAVLEHGITDIESLFPDYKSLNNPPAWIGQPEAWVTTVWNGTSKTPFSRVKSFFADITKDEARARGYIKGKKKLEEQFSLLKRTTDPQTVYKLQKLDRDDIIDITDFDVVAWLKSEMRMKLEEELSRAILIGDGRLASDESKIQETHIRSILNDDPFYSLKHLVKMSTLTDTTDRANAIIDEATMAMIDYKGSGSLTAFMAPQTLAYLRLAKDKNGRRLYNSTSEIASALGVSNIVEVPAMKDQTRTDDKSTVRKTLAILVNLRDYTIGADRGGQTTMFDDFDIDYNKYAYLIETRCSGALIKPASAIVLESDETVAASKPEGPSESEDEDEDKAAG